MEMLSYKEYFFLSLFSESSSRKMTTLYHILVGKRTASILYQAHEYRCKAFFSLLPKMKKSEYEQQMNRLLNLNCLEQQKGTESVLLTSLGRKQKENYFQHHHYPKNVNHLKNGKALKSFWKDCLFLTQVLSEIRHRNHSYIPIEKEWKSQQRIKRWLNEHSSSSGRDTVALSFGQEWSVLLDHMEPLSADLLMILVTGHQKIGKTKAQAADYFKVEVDEVECWLWDILTVLASTVARKKQDLPLFYSLYTDSWKEHYPESQSSCITRHYLKQGLSIEEIAQKRNLKVNTVAEHVIELTIVYPDKNFLSLMPEQIYQTLEKAMRIDPNITYQEFREQYQEIAFIWYRLFQIGRSYTLEP